ncbi:MAG: PIN domain-containing protein [Dehalococcoidia bacterium]|nr:PIN domain-containing protein [Dehalococcoidia bacterium]MSQ17346.1 PIN domain-containing protein [Dehalococcoidia bacterium]
MILVNTGPCVALFDPQEGHHRRCRETLESIREPLLTTAPVLTEAFHMLSPESYGSSRLREFIARGGLSVWFMDGAALQRAFALMEQYADHPMGLADASLVVAAEKLNTRKVFTLDRRDFAAYRVRRGHRYYGVEIVG